MTDFAEFCSLNKVVPTTLRQAEQIMHTVEAFIQVHPELLREIELFYRLERAKLPCNFVELEGGTYKFRKR